MALDINFKTLLWVLSAVIAVRWVLSQLSGVKRVGKSRLVTLLTGQVPTRFAWDRYGQEGYDQVSSASIFYPILSYSCDYHRSLMSLKQVLSKGKPFIGKVFGQDYWVLPPKYLTDIKTAPAQALSFFQALSDVRNPVPLSGHVGPEGGI